MDILFTTISGVLNGFHTVKARSNQPDVPIFDEEKIPILNDICDATKASVVLTSALRTGWGYAKKEPDNKRLRELLDSFKKYGVPYYGRTPVIEKRINEYSYYETWKEYEIAAYLECHPEVDHICILDNKTPDLESFDGSIVTPDFYTPTGENEGLMPYQKDEIQRVVKKNCWL